MDLVANSTPMVDFESRLNSFRVNRLKRFDFPTPESPMRTTLNRKSYSSLAITGKKARVKRDQGSEEQAGLADCMLATEGRFAVPTILSVILQRSRKLGYARWLEEGVVMWKQCQLLKGGRGWTFRSAALVLALTCQGSQRYRRKYHRPPDFTLFNLTWANSEC